jgi:hypothetical protein
MTSSPFNSSTLQESPADLPPAIYDGIIDELIVHFIRAKWQTRLDLKVDTRLMDVAQARAEDMATNDYFGHEDQKGIWPNTHVYDSGYRLPVWYPRRANQVESIALGYGTAVNALDALAESSEHEQHMTGGGFWWNHTRFGVGFAWHDDRRVWVIVTAPEEGIPSVPKPHHVLFLPHIGNGVSSA